MLSDELELMKYEFKEGINDYLGSRQSKMKDLEDIIEFNLKNKPEIMSQFGQDLMYSAYEKGSLNEIQYKSALQRILNFRDIITGLMDTNDLDALCGVGNGVTGPASMARIPSLTIPIGEVDEVPIGITFVVRAYGECDLLSIGYSFEQASLKRSAPKFLSSDQQKYMRQGI